MSQGSDQEGDVTVRPEDPAKPDVVVLLRKGEANSARLYPAESIHHASLDGLRAPDVNFFVARDVNGRALATGALVLRGEWAEIKRMWVEEDARGRGISKKMLNTLLSEAKDAGVKVVRLETGVISHAALGLYQSAGFDRREPFDGYKVDPQSVFMERHF